MKEVSLDLVPLGTGDVGAVHGLFRRWESYWKAPFVTSPDEILQDLSDPHLVPELDVRGVWSGKRLVAFGSVAHTPSGTRQERAHLYGRVDPACRGSGIGRRLLAWQVERAVERLRGCDPSIPWFVRVHQLEWVTDARHLYTRFGLLPARWFDELIRPLAVPLEVPLPEGVVIVGWDAAASEEVREVSNASFADHWGSTPRDSEAWEHILSSPTVRTDLSFVAVVGNRVVGLCLNAHYPGDEEATHRLDGWIAHLGVLSGWRRRGVAAALVARSLQAFREQGFTHALLGVDADNPSGASSLYRHLGFRPLARSVTHELRIHPSHD